jgi:cytochrome c-type biogenesis protein CcmE
MCFLPAYRALSALSRLGLHLQLLTNTHQLVLYLLASSETFWKLTECLAAGKGEMNCLGENERIQGLELVETVEKESQRRSSHRLAACSSSSIIVL